MGDEEEAEVEMETLAGEEHHLRLGIARHPIKKIPLSPSTNFYRRMLPSQVGKQVALLSGLVRTLSHSQRGHSQ